jgi:hypothetical protein
MRRNLRTSVAFQAPTAALRDDDRNLDLANTSHALYIGLTSKGSQKPRRQPRRMLPGRLRLGGGGLWWCGQCGVCGLRTLLRGPYGIYGDTPKMTLDVTLPLKRYSPDYCVTGKSSVVALGGSGLRWCW